MRILSRYIGRTVLVQTILVSLVLLTIYFLLTVMDELGSVGREAYTTITVLQYALLLLPRQLYELFPMLALLGGLLGLGTLAGSNELTVIQAAGVSVRRILLVLLKMALLMLLAVGLLGEFLAPQLEQQAQNIKMQALNRGVSLNVRGGLWVRDGDSYIHMRRLLSGGEAHDVSLYVFDQDQRLHEKLHAWTAHHEGGEWLLKNVTRSLVGHDGIMVEHLEQLAWQTGLTPEVVTVAALPADKLPVTELLGYVDYMRQNNLDAGGHELALWSRIVMPFAAAGMLLLAVPFIFGSLRSVSIGLRITVGGLAGIGFYMFNGIFGRLALVYGFPPWLGALLPTLLVYLVWWGLIRRIR